MRFAGYMITDWKDCEGRGSLGCLVSIVLMGALIIFGVRVGPPYFAYKSLQGDVDTEISRAGAHYYSDEALVQNIVDVAKKNEVRIRREDVRVERLAGQLQVSFQYRVPVDLIFFEHTFEFQVKASSFIGTL